MAKKPVITAAEAALWVKDGMTISTSGFVGSGMPEALSSALENRFLETGSPRDLTLFFAAAQGNRDGSGGDHYAHEGMLKRVIAGHYNLNPNLGKLIKTNMPFLIIMVILAFLFAFIPQITLVIPNLIYG